MGIEIPGALRTVASVAVGQDWPQTDETALRRLAEAWNTAADGVQVIGGDGDESIQAALAAITGEVNSAISDRWAEIDGGIEQLADVCRQLADTCGATANEVEKAKLTIIATLAVLAAEIALLLAAAAGTFGAASAAIPAAELAAQITVKTILKDLLKNVAKQAVFDAVVSGSIQALQVGQGHRDEVGWGATFKDGGYGAIRGGVGQVLGAPFKPGLAMAAPAAHTVIDTGVDITLGPLAAHVTERMRQKTDSSSLNMEY